uniref:Myosin N-terminal SH3-like domain-containing protein n=1 Tax=Aureoumbra lagunensis TaxID=44058 RepID=A0A7S3JUH5_9STRA|eukprot:CAMPEP_0197289270 /NCGR_PEP_ID=MMETSP0890-20130614/6509_1 /TAXON_ID=44058 ORGANISM="Aureoumbra lagunensis, Strain CCMP1510" /NCGR_SAMPLE_ID=MMETSP0890 /ASSEMBLY_ACC=CAM_ASM_000533 /LENGTH=144 /DNA_ID=CAMNT_0042760569 /DNA_START=63 /DNA_END=497 /DNA_ORIENTATION=+
MTEQTKVSVPDEKDVWVPADVIGSDGSVVKVKAIRPSEDSPLGGDELTEDTVEALEKNSDASDGYSDASDGYSDASELPPLKKKKTSELPSQNSGAAEGSSSGTWPFSNRRLINPLDCIQQSVHSRSATLHDAPLLRAPLVRDT